MRKLILILLVLSTVFLLASCHGTRDVVTFDIPEEFDEGKNYEITFWAKNDSNVTQANIYKKAIADFEAIYPNINVNLKLYTDYGRIYNDVITNIQTATTPNVCITYPDHIATYKTGDEIVVPLDSLISDRKYGLGGSEVKFDAPTKSEMIEKFLDEGKIEGIQYALPFMRSTEACYINIDLVEALGYTLPDVLTWDFVFEVSAAAMKPVGKDGNGKDVYINGQNVLIPFIYKSTDNMMIQMLKQRGAGYSSDNGEVLIFNEDTEDILYTVAEAAKLDSFSTFKISSYPGNYLNAGQCIFAIDSTAGATWMGANAPNLDIHKDDAIEFNIEVTEIPQYDVENPTMISQGPSICIFNKEDSGEVLASWLFAQYLLTNEVQIAYSQTEGYAPITKKAQESAEYLDYLSRAGEDNELYYDVKLKATKLLIENTENTFITPVFNGSASLRNAAGHLIESVVKSVNRNQKISASYLKRLYSETESLYKLNEISVSERGSFGPLPTMSIILISSVSAVWVGIISYLIYGFVKKRKLKK